MGRICPHYKGMGRVPALRWALHLSTRRAEREKPDSGEMKPYKPQDHPQLDDEIPFILMVDGDVTLT